jgi:prephenate dehydrogenase
MADGPFLPVIQAVGHPDRPAVFERVAVVGLAGLAGLGSAIAAAVRQAFPSALVIGVDRNDRLEACIRAGSIDIGAEDPIIAAEADLVLLAVPRAEQERWLAAVPNLIPGSAIVVTLAFEESVPAGATALPDRFSVVAGHVMLASPIPDLRLVTAAAIVDATWVLVAGHRTAAVTRLEAFVRALGARPVVVSTQAELAALAHDAGESPGSRDESAQSAV